MQFSQKCRKQRAKELFKIFGTNFSYRELIIKYDVCMSKWCIYNIKYGYSLKA